VPIARPAASAGQGTIAPTAAPQGSNALKIVLIVVAIIVGLGIIGTAAATFIGLRIARHTRVEQKDGKVTVHSPFGTVESNTDASEVAKDLGIEMYPNARPLKDGAADVHIGNMHNVSAQFETDDPPDKVAEFYRSRIPNANVNVSNGDQYTIVSTQKNNIVTVNIEKQDGKTRIHIANVMGKGINADTNSSD
jgi:hypothetical protein